MRSEWVRFILDRKLALGVRSYNRFLGYIIVLIEPIKVTICTMLRRFSNEARGSVAVIFAVTSPVFLGMSALAIDFAAYSKYQGQLQFAADSAVLATAKELTLANTNEKALRSIAISYVRSSAGKIARGARVNLEIKEKEGSVKVTVTMPWSPFFAQYFSKAITPVIVTATARVRSSGKICVIGLAEKEKNTIYMDDKSHLVGNNCGVYSNSRHPDGIKVDKGGKLSAEFVCSAGGIKKDKSAEVYPTPTIDCPQVQDPLAKRKPPSIGSCTAIALAVKDEDRTLSPGVYCKGLKIEGNSKVSLQPGIYVIKDDKFEISDTATVNGRNVAFHLANDATFKFDKQSTVNLTAPKDGPLAGILFFEDRANKRGLTHKITSDYARLLLGTIYLSRGELEIDSGGPVADKSAYTAIVVQSIKLKEGPVLQLNSNYSATDIPVPSSLIGGDIILDR